MPYMSAVVTMALAGLVMMAGFACAVPIIAHAFKRSVPEGLLCIFVPIYTVYYAVDRYASPRKALILTGYFGGFALGVVLALAGGYFAAKETHAKQVAQTAPQTAARAVH